MDFTTQRLAFLHLHHPLMFAPHDKAFSIFLNHPISTPLASVFTLSLLCLVYHPSGNFSLHHCVQNASGAHPASYPVGTRGFPWKQSSQGVKLTTHLHLVLRAKNGWSYTFTPQIHHHGMELS
jgi:hypothetical protein